MKKIFTLALLAVFALVGCNPDTPNGGGNGESPTTVCDQHDVDLVLSEVSGIYYGNQYSESEDVYGYGLVLSNKSDVYDFNSGMVSIWPNSQYLFLLLHSATASPNLSLTFRVPNGIYELDLEDSTAANTTEGSMTNLYITSEEDGVETFFKSGTVTVTHTLIDAVLVGEDDKVYHIQCENKLVDNTTAWALGEVPGEFSTLTDNLVIPFNADGAEIYAMNWGDYLVVGKNQWYMEVCDWTTGDVVSLAVHADFSKEFPVGTYPISNNLSIEATLLGYIDADMNTQGSWWCNEEGENMGLAPLKSGSLIFVHNADDTYTVTINAEDGQGHTISGVCTAPASVEEPYSLSKLSTASKFSKMAKRTPAPRKVKPTFVVKK